MFVISPISLSLGGFSSLEYWGMNLDVNTSVAKNSDFVKYPLILLLK